MSDRIVKLTDDIYSFDGKKYDVPSLLDALRDADEKEGGRFFLSYEESRRLSAMLSGYSGYPDFEKVAFMAASSSLFRYIASSGDEALLRKVAFALGWKSDAEKLADITSYTERSRAYREWWLSYSEALLTRDGLDDFRFGKISSDRDGCYLYDDEKAVMYVEVSRDGDERRNCVLSLTLLGNPEAVTDEEQNREFEWCCYFDDLIGSEGDDAVILGGALRTIDPYGESSRLMRRYDIVYRELLPSELALVTSELIRLLGMYPPEG